GGPGAAPETWTPVLEAAFAGVTGVSSITVIDETGFIRASTIRDLVGGDRHDRHFFQNLANDVDAGLVADVPFRSRRAARLLLRPLWDGGPVRLSAYRSLSSPPLVVAVSRAEKDVLAAWRRIALLALGLAVALGIALLLAAFLISREIRDRTAATARLIETD